MTDPRKNQRIDDAGAGFDPELARKAKRWAIVVALVLVVGAAFFIFRAVNEGRRVDRWEELAKIERKFDLGSNHAWLQAADQGYMVTERDREIRELEDFLARNDSDDAIAVHVHSTIAERALTQALGLLGAGSTEPLTPHLDRAKQHLEALRDRYPDAQVNWGAFAAVVPGRGGATRTKEAATLPRLLLQRVESMRTWETEHGAKKIDPDADVTVLLRTTGGDLAVRVFSTASPRLVAGFLKRVCAGDLDGVRIFERKDDYQRGWVRVGDDRTRAEKPTADDRVAWEEPTPGEGLLPDGGRYLLSHTVGTIAAWHGEGEQDDDAQQFVVITKDSPSLNSEYTPFARVEEGASRTVLERLASESKTFAKDPAARKADAKLARVSEEQFVQPPVIKRALVYEKGALKACHDASKVDASEKALSTVVPDAFREKPPTPPAAPAAPATPPAAPAMGDAPPMGDAPMGADAPMDGTK